MSRERTFRCNVPGPIRGRTVTLAADRRTITFPLLSDSLIEGRGYISFDTSAGSIRFNNDGTATWGGYALEEIFVEAAV